MKKIILLVVVGILVLSGLGAAEIQKDNTETQQTLEIFTFSEPSFEIHLINLPPTGLKTDIFYRIKLD